jgi:rhodanese-related sulfurtransferase
MPEHTITKIDPTEAQNILTRDPNARLIDVRSKVEFGYVGHPIRAVHVPWKEFPDWNENPNFAAEVDAALTNDGEVSKDRALLMICRSGARSLKAGEALLRVGYTSVYNVEEGFEGDKDEHQHRGNINGWRYRGLPWEQG